MLKNITLLAVLIMPLLIACQNKDKQARSTHLLNAVSGKVINEDKTLADSFKNDKSISVNETLVDSLYKLLNGSFYFDDNIKNSLPTSAFDYFSNIQFPISSRDSFEFDYFIGRLPFTLTDYYIFNQLNKFSACEYVAMGNSSQEQIEIIAQQCVDMENWICLYVFDKDYKVVRFELLINTGRGGFWEENPLIYHGDTIREYNYNDTLKYKKCTYEVTRSTLYELTNSIGKKRIDVGLKEVRRIVIQKNNCVSVEKYNAIRKDYVDLLKH